MVGLLTCKLTKNVKEEGSIADMYWMMTWLLFSFSHILLTTDSLMVLRELSDRAGWARVKHRHKLESVLKITAKKKHPDIITFKFGTGSGDNFVITEQLRFRIPNTQKATLAIKTQIVKYTQTQR